MNINDVLFVLLIVIAMMIPFVAPSLIEKRDRDNDGRRTQDTDREG